MGAGKRLPLNPRQKKTDRNNKILMFLCCLYMAMLTGLLIPSAVISASPAEFVDAHYYQNPARYLTSSALMSTGLFIILIPGCGLMLPPRVRKRYTTVLAAAAAVSAMDYMFFGRDYGFISSALKYETSISNPAGMIFLNAVCAAATAAIVVLMRKKHSQILRIVCLYSCAALAVMSVMNINSITEKAGEVRDITDRIKAEDASFRLDKKGRNVVVIMLDRAISGFVPYMLSEKPELKDQFDGFTWYPNTLSYGYHTNIAAPALYGGYEYTPDGMEARPELPLKEKHNEALKVMPLNFMQAGYEVTVCDAPYANYQWIPDMSIYDDYPGIHTYNTIGMFDDYKVQMLEYLDHIRSRNLFFYSLFRSAPLVLQPVIYDSGRYLEPGGNVSEGEGADLIGVSADFLNSYMVMQNLDQLTRITEDGTDTFLMIANEMTHDAVELQKPDYTPQNHVDNKAYYAEHGKLYTEDGKELDLAGAEEFVRIHYDSDMAALIMLGRWFDDLKEQGVYDNTRIIIVSDHGCYLGLFGTDLKEKYSNLSAAGYNTDEWTDTMCYNPLLLVKDFGTSGFHTDYRFMTNAETPSLAFKNTVADPVNPFTGNRIISEAGKQGEYHVIESDWHIANNCGNIFSNPLRIVFRGDNIFDGDSWSVDLPENTGKP